MRPVRSNLRQLWPGLLDLTFSAVPAGSRSPASCTMGSHERRSLALILLGACAFVLVDGDPTITRHDGSGSKITKRKLLDELDKVAKKVSVAVIGFDLSFSFFFSFSLRDRYRCHLSKIWRLFSKNISFFYEGQAKLS